VRAALGPSLLAVVPRIGMPARPPRRTSAEPLRIASDRNEEVQTAMSWLGRALSPICWESYRSLRTRLLLAPAVETARTVMITSAHPGEGKTTTALNLARALAAAKEKTVVVELDLRAPRIEGYLGLSSARGMSDYLAGTCGLREIVLETQIPNLSVLPAGPPLTDSWSDIDTAQWASLFADLSAEYRYVIIDTPPVLSISDALTIAPHTDGVILVIWAGRTPRKAVVEAESQISFVGGKILGFILNGADIADADYREYYGSYKVSEVPGRPA
jgi:receptor protein-tyrosine kinase